ncbi:hypothetical protein B0T13DRAFT_444455 [Neurospora crassa]|nr:hypothetical protein B0T13DRAFT_444455 [Neurospora crassa]
MPRLRHLLMSLPKRNPTVGRRTGTRTTNRIDIKIPGWPSLAWNQHAYPAQSEAEAPPNFGPIRMPLNNGWTTANDGGISLDICRSIWSIAVPVGSPRRLLSVCF